MIVVIIISKATNPTFPKTIRNSKYIYVSQPYTPEWKIAFLQKVIFIVVIFIYQKESPVTWPRDAGNPLLNCFLCWQPCFKVSFKLIIMAMIITTTLKMLIFPLMRMIFENTFQASASREKERGPRPWRTPALNYKVHKERNNCKFQFQLMNIWPTVQQQHGPFESTARQGCSEKKTGFPLKIIKNHLCPYL